MLTLIIRRLLNYITDKAAKNFYFNQIKSTQDLAFTPNQTSPHVPLYRLPGRKMDCCCDLGIDTVLPQAVQRGLEERPNIKRKPEAVSSAFRRHSIAYPQFANWMPTVDLQMKLVFVRCPLLRPKINKLGVAPSHHSDGRFLRFKPWFDALPTFSVDATSGLLTRSNCCALAVDSQFIVTMKLISLEPRIRQQHANQTAT